jgi:chromosome segregation ATPase
MPITQAAREAEAELQRKNQQILAVARQIEATQAELQQLRVQATSSDSSGQAAGAAAAAARIQQARELVASTKPELESMKENLAKALKVSTQLDAWFVENATKMSIQDTSTTPSAFLQRLLQSCDRRLEVLNSGMARTMEQGIAAPSTTQTTSPPYRGVLANAVATAAQAGNMAGAVPPGNQTAQFQQQQTSKQWSPAQPLGSVPGVQPVASQPGGAGVAGMWVRDPDAG